MKRIIITALISAAMCACSSSHTDSKEAISKAVDYGKAHALRLLDAAPDTTKMQTILLETRAREAELRESGHDGAADQYVKAFEEFVRENNESLAQQVFDTPNVK